MALLVIEKTHLNFQLINIDHIFVLDIYYEIRMTIKHFLDKTIQSLIRLVDIILMLCNQLLNVGVNA